MSNPYEQFINTESSSKNPYDQFLGDKEEQPSVLSRIKDAVTTSQPDEAMQGHFNRAEEKYGLPKGLLVKMGRAESNFDPEAVSSAGAKGVMQFMPSTSEHYGIDPTDTAAAIDAAGDKMKGLVKYYHGDMDKAIAAYNYGEGNLDNHISAYGDKWKSNLNKETSHYLNTINSDIARRSGVGDVLTTVGKGALQVPSIITGLADIPMGMMNIDRPFDKASNYLGNATGFKPEAWAKAADKNLSDETQLAQQNVNDVWRDPNTGAWDVAKTYLQNPRAIGAQIGESVVPMVAGGGISRVVGGVTKLAPYVLGGIGEGSIAAGSMMNQVDDHVAPTKAAYTSLADGLVTAAFGVGGGKLANKLGITDIHNVMAGGNVVGSALSKPVRIVAGALEEGLLQEAPQSYADQALQNYAEGKPINQDAARATIEGMLSGGVIGGGVNAITPNNPPEDPIAPIANATNVDAAITAAGEAIKQPNALNNPSLVTNTGFGKLSEFNNLADSIAKEKAAAIDALLAQQDLQRESKLESLNSSVAEHERLVSQTNRLLILDNVLQDDNIADDHKEAKFAADIARSGYTDTNLTDFEQEHLSNYLGLLNANDAKEADRLPSSPNEQNYYKDAKNGVIEQPAIATDLNAEPIIDTTQASTAKIEPAIAQSTASPDFVGTHTLSNGTPVINEDGLYRDAANNFHVPNESIKPITQELIAAEQPTIEAPAFVDSTGIKAKKQTDGLWSLRRESNAEVFPDLTFPTFAAAREHLKTVRTEQQSTTSLVNNNNAIATDIAELPVAELPAIAQVAAEPVKTAEKHYPENHSERMLSKEFRKFFAKHETEVDNGEGEISQHSSNKVIAHHEAKANAYENFIKCVRGK